MKLTIDTIDLKNAKLDNLQMILLYSLIKTIMPLSNNLNKDIIETYIDDLNMNSKKQLTVSFNHLIDNNLILFDEKTNNISLIEQEQIIVETKKDKNKKQFSDDVIKKCEEIIQYLNTKVGKHFQAKTYYGLINSRLKDNYTVDDFKKVIDNKYNDWNNNEFAKYLKPATLFKEKHFDSYLNETTRDELREHKRGRKNKGKTLSELTADDVFKM